MDGRESTGTNDEHVGYYDVLSQCKTDNIGYVVNPSDDCRDGVVVKYSVTTEFDPNST